jgi:hypothetical protein
MVMIIFDGDGNVNSGDDGDGGSVMMMLMMMMLMMVMMMILIMVPVTMNVITGIMMIVVGDNCRGDGGESDDGHIIVCYSKACTILFGIL